MRAQQNSAGQGPPGYGGYGPPPGGYGPPPGPGGYGPPPGPGGYGPPPGPGGYGPPGHGSGFGGPGFAAPPGAPQGGSKTDQLAVAGLICSILGIVGAILNGISGLFGACCVLCTVGATILGIVVLIPSVAGVVMGGMSVSRINKNPEALSGKGMAIAALVLGAIATLGALAEIVLPWLGMACFAASGAASSP